MKTKLLISILALQAAWIVGTVVVQDVKLQRGAVAHLETMPVDPRDLLRGDYVILNYTISTLPASLFAGGLTNEAPTGTPVYVRLEKRGEFHEAEAASFDPLESDVGRPVLRGKVSSRMWWEGDRTTNRSLRVDFGLERYYVREGTGNPRGKLTVDVSVPSSGNAVIRQVYIDGKPYKEVMKDEGR